MPARGPEISVKISAKADQFSASVAQIKKDLAALPQIANQASRKLGGQGAGGFSIGRISRQIETQIGRAYSGASGLAGRGIGAISSATRGIPGFGVLAGAASIAGLGEMVSHFASAGVELTNTARLAGTSAEGLNSLRGAARLIGLSAGDADAAMLGLNHTLQDAAFGRNATAAATFQQLGISFGDMAHGARTAGQVLPDIVDKITELAKTDPRRAEHLLDLVGIPSSALPLLMRGREALEDQRREVESIYGSFSKYQAASEQFTAAQGRMGLSAEKLGMSIMTALAPALSPMLVQLSRFVDSHQTDIADTFGRIGSAIAGVKWDQVGKAVDQFGRYLSSASAWADDFATKVNRVLDAMREVDHVAQQVGRAPHVLAQATLDSGIDPITGQIIDTPTTIDEGRRRISRMTGAWEYGGEPLPANAAALPSAEQRRRTQQGRDMLMNLGWTSAQASGIMANLNAESQLNQGAVGDSGQAYGIAQWHPSRRNAIASGFGRSPVGASYEEQIRMVDWELRNSERAAGDALRRTNTAAQAGAVVSTQYERPLDVQGNAFLRAQSAAVLDRYLSALPAPTPAAAAPSATPTSQTPTQRFNFPMHDDPSTWPKPPEDNGRSTVRVEIDHSNVPPGVTLNATTKGDGVELGGIRVRKAMPEAGGMGAFGGT